MKYVMYIFSWIYTTQVMMMMMFPVKFSFSWRDNSFAVCHHLFYSLPISFGSKNSVVILINELCIFVLKWNICSILCKLKKQLVLDKKVNIDYGL